MFWMILAFVLAHVAPTNHLPDQRTWTRQPELVNHWTALHEEPTSENKPIRKKAGVNSVVIIDM